MGAWNDCLATSKPFRRARFVERSSLGVELHIPRVDPWAKNPRVVQVALARLDQQNFQVVIKIGQPELLFSIIAQETREP